MQLSFPNAMQLNFPNSHMAVSAHFFNEAFANYKSLCGSVNFLPLFKESNKKNKQCRIFKKKVL